MSLPAGWKKVYLEEAYWFQEGPGVRKWQFTDSGIKLLNVANIEKSGHLNLAKTDRHLSINEVTTRYQHFLIDEGDLVIASSGISFDIDGLLRTRGAFVESRHLPLCLNTSTIRFKAKAAISDLTYLKFWLDSRDFREQITKLVTGSAQQNFGPSHLKAIRIVLPPLSEQRRIAAILDQADTLRAKRRESLAQLESLKQAIFLDMFGDPARNPKGWCVSRIDSVTECLDKFRRPITESERSPGSVPYYGANGQQGWIDEFLFDEPLILVAEDGGHFENPERGVAYRIDGPAWVNNHAHILRPKFEILNLEYCHQVLRHFNFQPYVSGTTRAKLTQGQLNSVMIPIPPLHYQETFDFRAREIQNLIGVTKEASIDSEKLFSALQHRAFRGEL